MCFIINDKSYQLIEWFLVSHLPYFYRQHPPAKVGQVGEFLSVCDWLRWEEVLSERPVTTTKGLSFDLCSIHQWEKNPISSDLCPGWSRSSTVRAQEWHKVPAPPPPPGQPLRPLVPDVYTTVGKNRALQLPVTDRGTCHPSEQQQPGMLPVVTTHHCWLPTCIGHSEQLLQSPKSGVCWCWHCGLSDAVYSVTSKQFALMVCTALNIACCRNI